MTAKRKFEAQRWFQQASYDLKATRWNIEGRFYDTACFLAQQAGEKALKSLLYYQGARRAALMTHSLVEMIRESGKKAPQMKELLEQARALDLHYIPSRYPMEFPADIPISSDEGTVVDLFLGSHGRTDAVDLAPWVPTPQPVVDRMLELASVTGRDVLFDIGCGDGRIVITAARRYGTRGIGIDIDKAMVLDSERNAAAAGVERLVRFIDLDATKADISEATVVSLYLLPESNSLMRPILETQLRPKSRVICHNYEIPGWQEKKVLTETVEDENGEKHYIYLYVAERRGPGQPATLCHQNGCGHSGRP